MVTKSVYVIGGAGAGKSTFTAELLDGWEFLELWDLYSERNAKNLVTLRGHDLVRDGWADGMYLGCMRDEFPGTDGLDRATSPVGAAWLRDNPPFLPSWIVSEGATLSTRPFMSALAETTQLLLIHLYAPVEVKAQRFKQRGSNQKEEFVQATATRSANLLRDMTKAGVRGMTVDTSDPDAWDLALDIAAAHLW